MLQDSSTSSSSESASIAVSRFNISILGGFQQASTGNVIILKGVGSAPSVLTTEGNVVFNGRGVSTRFAIMKDLAYDLIIGLPELESLGILKPVRRVVNALPAQPDVMVDTVGVQSDKLVVVQQRLSHIGDQNMIEEVTAAIVQTKDVLLTGGVGSYQGPPVHIVLTDTSPVVQKSRPLNNLMKNVLRVQLDKLLANGAIEPSRSAYSSPVHLVRKKDSDKYRLTIDYRLLNRKVKPDSYPLPHMQHLLMSTAGKRYYSVVDLEAGFHNLKLADSAKELTAFVTPFGLYQFNVLPFGFRNAPAEFQRVTDHVLSVFNTDNVNGYIDDIVIGTNSLSEHVLLLKQVLQRLETVGLRINVDKLQLIQPEITFLGHIVNRVGVAPDPSRYTALKALRRPQSKDELRSFLGSVNFCCRFIPNFSLTAAPLNRLLKKNVAYEWTETESAAYEALLLGLQNAITLNTPTDDGDYFVFADACENGCGGAVVQLTDGVPGVLAVYSKAFTDAEKNWPTREQEAFAIKFVMEKASDLLAGHSVVVLTDHQSLKWIRESANARVQRWLSFLADKDVKIVHLSGVDNFLADWLSRCVKDADADMEKTMEKIMVPVYPVTLENLAIPSMHDLMNLEVPEDELKDLIQDDKGIYVHYKTNAVYVPVQFRDVFILWHHALGVGGHRGINATVQRLRKYVYWRNMHESVRTYISGCLLCKRNSTLCRSEISEVMERKVPFAVVSMDAFFHRIHGIQHCVIVAIDHCTRFMVTQVVDQETGVTYVGLLKLLWVPYFGAPQAVLVDNKVGNDFVSYVTGVLGA